MSPSEKTGQVERHLTSVRRHRGWRAAAKNRVLGELLIMSYPNFDVGQISMYVSYISMVELRKKTKWTVLKCDLSQQLVELIQDH